jgi:LPS-assembly protein
MVLRRGRCLESSLRLLRAGLLGLSAALISCAPVLAQSLLPAGFFQKMPAKGGQANIEANILAYDAGLDLITAEGEVLMYYEGYELRSDTLDYNQATGEVIARGDVRMRDPEGTLYYADSVHVTGGMKEAFLESLTLTTTDGSLIRATDVHYASELLTILTDAHYSPCGLCIDEKGRRIGWKVNATKITYDRKNAVVYLDSPSLEILGIPVAWLPWMAVPDPSQPRAQGFRTPSVDYNEAHGGRLSLPYFMPLGEDIDLLLTPMLMTRQGALMAADWTHRLPLGEYGVKASGLYQLDPSAYAGEVGEREWRGAIQTTGKFRPIDDWTTGWSYTAFTDAGYIGDYSSGVSKDVTNEVYATYLTTDTYLDMRVQQFQKLGKDVTWGQQEEQTRTIPSVTAAHYLDLGDMGRVDFSARALGIQRGRDSTDTYGGVPYAFAYSEHKVHLMVQAAWQNQYITPAGVLVTPYLGLRGDAAYVAPGTPSDGSATILSTPVSLLSATPIAALDFRWPLMAVDGNDAHLFEPIAQLVYRGSSTTLPGITNDDSQGFVFDDTNLFSFNRFSGIDRQETGLRANIGGRYLASFDDGSWLQLIGGQSYHLAGLNALGVSDPTEAGNATGLGSTASYVVLGVQGSPAGGLKLGAKTQIDPDGFVVRRATAAAALDLAGFRFGTDYTYIAATPALGIVDDQHEATATVSGPLPIDYWFFDAGLSWDLAQNQFLEATGGVTYDDGYFVAGGFGKVTGPTHSSPSSTSFGIKFALRSPAGEVAF